MSVLHLLGSDGDGGAETYFVDLVSALHRAGVAEACAIRRHAARTTALAEAGVIARTFGFGGPLDVLMDARVMVAWMNRAGRHTPAGPWKRIGRLGGYYSLKYYAGFDHLVGNTADIATGSSARAGRPRSYIPNFAEPDEVSPAPSRAARHPRERPSAAGHGPAARRQGP
jgi:hypothetical protein